MRATAPPLLPGRPRAASRCLRLQRRAGRTVRVRPSWPPRTACRIPATGSWHNVSASALRIALYSRGGAVPFAVLFQQRTRKLASRLGPLRGRHFAALNRVSLPGEPAGMRAKGGAGTGMFHPRRSVRQANGVKVPRQRREDRQPLSGLRLRYHPCLTDKYAPGVFCHCRGTLCSSAHATAVSNMGAMTSYPLCRLSIKCLFARAGLTLSLPFLTCVRHFCYDYVTNPAILFYDPHTNAQPERKKTVHQRSGGVD